MSSKADVNLAGALGLIKKSSNFFASIFEAVTNSFEAINEKEFEENETPVIDINFYFSSVLNEVKNFERVEIIDNGLGFTDQSFLRYKVLLDKSKGFKKLFIAYCALRSVHLLFGMLLYNSNIAEKRLFKS